MVPCTASPALRRCFKHHLQSHQTPIKIAHDLCVGEPHCRKPEVAHYPLVAHRVGSDIMGVAINLDNQTARRTKEIDNPRPDHLLAAEFVPIKLLVLERTP